MLQTFSDILLSLKSRRSRKLFATTRSVALLRRNRIRQAHPTAEKMSRFHWQFIDQRFATLLHQPQAIAAEIDALAAHHQRRGHTLEAGLFEQLGDFRETVFLEVQAAGLGPQVAEAPRHVRRPEQPVGRDRHQQPARLEQIVNVREVLGDFVGADVFEDVVPINERGTLGHIF